MAEDDRYCFNVEWFDKLSGYTNKYQLSFYENDGSVEMFDIKNKRTFLKKSVVPGLSLDDMYIGGKITVNARVLTIMEYADTSTRDKLARTNERVVGIIEPRANMGNIITELKREHLNLTQLRLLRLSPPEVVTLKKIGGSNYSALKEGLNLALEVQGKSSCRKYEMISKDYNKMVGSSSASFGSSSVENAFQESKLLFMKRDPCAYFSNCTLCLIKPHAVKEGFTGEIMNAMMEEGFNITALEMVNLTEAQATEFFIAYKGVLPEYADLVAEMSTGPSVALEIRGETRVVEKFREFCGPHDPDLARSLRPHTLRALFGMTKSKNAVYCTDLPEEALEEVFYFFHDTSLIITSSGWFGQSITTIQQVKTEVLLQQINDDLERTKQVCKVFGGSLVVLGIGAIIVACRPAYFKKQWGDFAQLFKKKSDNN